MIIKNFLRFLNIRAQKARAQTKEELPLERYLNDVSIKKAVFINDPFEYIVIDDVFTEEAHNGLTDFITSIKKKGYAEHPARDRAYPFKYVTGYLEKYGGYFYAPRYKENIFTDIFFSVRWNLFIEKTCGHMTNEFVSTTLHIHTEGNRRGWTHTDNQEVFFNRKDTLPNGMVFQNPSRTEFTNKTARSVAVIYYCANEGWKEGDGGETGIFRNPEDKESCATVVPKNNRLLIMKISPKSFHAFMGNKTERNAFVQWFHQDSLEM